MSSSAEVPSSSIPIPQPRTRLPNSPTSRQGTFAAPPAEDEASEISWSDLANLSAAVTQQVPQTEVAAFVSSRVHVTADGRYVPTENDLATIIQSLPPLSTIVYSEPLTFAFDPSDPVYRLPFIFTAPLRATGDYRTPLNDYNHGMLRKEQVLQLLSWAGLAMRQLGRPLCSKAEFQDYIAITEAFNRKYQAELEAELGPGTYLEKGYNDINSAFLKKAFWPKFVKDVLGL